MFDFAKVAYDAYCESTGWKSLVSGAPLPQWADVRVEIKAAWDVAAQAVIRAASKTPS